MQHTKEGSIFLYTDSDTPKAFLVKGLYDPIENIIEDLPFKGIITYGGIFNSYNLMFGGGIKKTLKIDLKKAQNTYGLINSLEKTLEKQVDADKELLKTYAYSEENRYEYEDEISKILQKNPKLWKDYYKLIGQSNVRNINKKLSKFEVNSHFFAILEDTVIACGENEKEVLNKVAKLLPGNKKDYVHIFKHKK